MARRRPRQSHPSRGGRTGVVHGAPPRDASRRPGGQLPPQRPGPRHLPGPAVLPARVLLRRSGWARIEPRLAPPSFGALMGHGHGLGWPTADELAYALTPLFPPVRPRGWLELRMLDAVPAPWWRVATGVTSVFI